MSNCIGCLMNENRDFREETSLNGAEEITLKCLSGELGLSKAAVLRLGLHRLANDINRKRRLDDTGITTVE